MKCKCITVKSKKFRKFFYCRKMKKEINLEDCRNCNEFECRQIYKMKNKSNKLAKAEKKRFSILTNNLTKCYECSKAKKHMHEIYKGSNRQVSIRNGFCIPFCEECHERSENDIDFLRKFQKECQKKFEEEHTHEEFMQLVGRNFL